MVYRKMLACLFCLMFAATSASAIEKSTPDPAGVQVLNSFLSSLATPQEPARENAVLPFVHKSLLSKDGKGLAPNIKNFSYKKASANLKFYKVPAEVTEVHKGNTVTVGFKETAETGHRDKYFINKIDPKNGRPAPIIIFFPQGGGSPKVIDFGSL